MRRRQQAIINISAFSKPPKIITPVQEVPDMRIYAPKGSTMPSMSVTQTAVSTCDYQGQHEEENRRLWTLQTQQANQTMSTQQLWQMQNML
jgi:hypothetical protein